MVGKRTSCHEDETSSYKMQSNLRYSHLTTWVKKHHPSLKHQRGTKNTWTTRNVCLGFFSSAHSLHWGGGEDKAEIPRKLYCALIASHHPVKMKDMNLFFSFSFFISQTNFTVSKTGEVIIAPAATRSVLQRKLLVFSSGRDQVHLYVNVFTGLSCPGDKIAATGLKEQEEFHCHWFGEAKYLAQEDKGGRFYFLVLFFSFWTNKTEDRR